jgi:hypothetical protein
MRIKQNAVLLVRCWCCGESRVCARRPCSLIKHSIHYQRVNIAGLICIHAFRKMCARTAVTEIRLALCSHGWIFKPPSPLYYIIYISGSNIYGVHYLSMSLCIFLYLHWAFERHSALFPPADVSPVCIEWWDIVLLCARAHQVQRA